MAATVGRRRNWSPVASQELSRATRGRPTGRPWPDAGLPLLRALDSKDYKIRIAAAEALARSGTPRRSSLSSPH